MQLNPWCFTIKTFCSEVDTGAKLQQQPEMYTHKCFFVTQEMFLQEVNKKADREGL